MKVLLVMLAQKEIGFRFSYKSYEVLNDTGKAYEIALTSPNPYLSEPVVQKKMLGKIFLVEGFPLKLYTVVAIEEVEIRALKAQVREFYKTLRDVGLEELKFMHKRIKQTYIDLDNLFV